MLNLPYVKSEGSTHDGRSTPSTTQRPWMEPLLSHGLQQEILLCAKVAYGRNLYRASCKARASNRRPSTRETSQNKIKPAKCWQRTIKNSAAVRTSQKVLANSRDDPEYFCATFMIHSPPTNCQGMLHKNGTCSKGKSVSYVHSPHDIILQKHSRAFHLYYHTSCK